MGPVQLPAILHLPDQGSFRISSAQAGALGYEATNGDVKISFPGATGENPVVKYRCEVVSIHPRLTALRATPGLTASAAIG